MTTFPNYYWKNIHLWVFFPILDSFELRKTLGNGGQSSLSSGQTFRPPLLISHSLSSVQSILSSIPDNISSKNILKHGLSCSQSSKEEEICEYIFNILLLPQDFLNVFKNRRPVKRHSHKNRLLFILVFLMMILRSVRIRSRS